MKRIWTALCLCCCMAATAQTENTVTVNEQTFQLMNDLSNSQLGTGDIYLFTTTHQDLGWIDHPEMCIIFRDTMWLTPFFERLEKEPDFRMDIEQTSILMEYLHRYPDRKEQIARWLRDGRICVGATYVQPYEEMYAGESLARQFYLGNRWLKQTFGYSARSYLNVDVPGRTLQIPQLMSRAGVENLVVSRHERGLFRWESPDGSSVRTYSPGHYVFFYGVLALADTTAFRTMAKEAVLWYAKYNNVPGTKAVMPAMLNYEFIWDQKPVKNCGPFTAKWNAITHIRTEDGSKTVGVRLPKFRHATADDFFDALDASTKELPTIHGERPNVWLYIHGPSHEQAITASRKGDILLPAAEKIASFNALVDGHFMHYPQQRLAEAWKSKIYPDHGWGGKNGEITDNTFRRHFEYALSEAESMVETGLNRLASQVQTKPKKGEIPIVVFNTLSWKRSDPVRVAINLNRGYAHTPAVKDARGRVIPCQIADVERYDDGSIRTAQLCFVAEDVPPLGYATFHLHARTDKPTTSPALSGHTLENAFYRITFAPGGIRRIEDRALGVDLLESSEYLGGEVVTLHSLGNGAGEFDAVQQPTMAGFDKTSLHAPEWSVLEHGEVYTTLFCRSNIRHAVAEQKVTVYHQTKKIDFDIAIRNWEGTLYREFRMMLPVNAGGGESAYEVPYGVVRIGRDEMPGAAGERYLTPNKELHPRGIGNWFSVSGKDFGVTLSSSVAVVDHIDPAGKTDMPVIQPILFASRRSCHGEGNEYRQYGDHTAHFSLTSHPSGWQQGYRFGVGSNETLHAVFSPNAFGDAKLPPAHSFFAIDSENVVISAVKKCEDDESLTVRLYNLSDRPETVRLAPWLKPSSVVRLNLIEAEQETVDEIRLGGYAVETFKLNMK